jgi:hypothetical protein
LSDANRLALPRDRDLLWRAGRVDRRDAEGLRQNRDNGRKRFQHFCPHCDAPLFTSGEGDQTDDWGIRWRSIRQRDRLKPARQIWCRSAVPWIKDIEELPGRPMD